MSFVKTENLNVLMKKDLPMPQVLTIYIQPS